MADTLQEQEEELLKQKELISQYETEANDILAEEIPQRRFGSGVTRQTQQQYLLRKEQASNYLQNLSMQKTEVATGISEIEKYKEKQNAFRLAEKYAKRAGLLNDPIGLRAGYINLKQKGQSEAYKYMLDLYRYYKKETSTKPKPIEDTYIVNPKYNFTPVNFTPSDYYIPINYSSESKMPTSNKYGYSAFDYKVIKGTNKPDYLEIGGKEVYYNIKNKNQNMATLPPKPKGILESTRVKLGTVAETSNNILYEGLAGVGASAIGTAQYFKNYAKEYIKNPLLTPVKSLVKPVYFVGKRIVTGEGFPEVGKRIKEDTAFSVGYVAGEVIQFKAPQIAIKVSDIARTINLKELPATDIIAPEYFAGQKYPQIKKGQTAGELLQEFSLDVYKLEGYSGKGSLVSKKEIPKLPFKVKQAGFTASPAPLGQKIALAGTSELPGLYQAPKLSATFLRVSGESGTIGSNILPTLKPTSFKIYPTSIELISGVTKEQRSLTPLSKARKFYKEKSILGKSYVPFIKTEKEAIIPAGTLLEELPAKYYFKFEGRRIPIKEYKTTGGEKITSISEYKTTKDISKYYSSYGKVSKIKPINPYTISRYSSLGSKLSKSKNYIPSSLVKYKGSSSMISKSSLSKSLSSSTISKSTSKSLGLSSSYGGYSRNIKTGYTPYINPPTTTTKTIITNPQKIKRSYGNIKVNKDLTTAFRTFIKVGGKKTYLTGLREKGSALKYGEDVATRTLRATFGVEATRQKIKGISTQYTPSKIFRGYRISGGKKIALKDTYIQKLGKRLSTRSEISELQLSRRRK